MPLTRPWENRQMAWIGEERQVIHHYTSVAALAAILHSGRLRFTRLDRFDDVLEAQTVAGIDFGAQLFASCWVKQDAEDIAQWSMYGDTKQGVRISLPDDPFAWQLLNAFHQVPGTNAKWHFDNAEAPFPLDEVFGDGYLLLPVIDRSRFLKEVLYVDDVVQAYRRHVRHDGETIVIDGYPTELARYKWNRWAFQREHRFVLTTVRGPRRTEDPAEYGECYHELVRDPLWHRQGALSPYIDLKFAPSALQDMIVTIGPLCSDAGREEVGRLCARYAPCARIRMSELQGKIRPKA
ncbi:hypothetical protein [Luteimonas saliphila]|uniref:hypothetical protein n=1 Tax=Luteimonas saliphila TaxID=2804919 RepID=UPI00192DFF39|nr:hypothetical protein [Luteimonas saliphila]